MKTKSRKLATILALAAYSGPSTAQYSATSIIDENANWNAHIDVNALEFYMQGSRLADKFRQNNLYGLF